MAVEAIAGDRAAGARAVAARAAARARAHRQSPGDLGYLGNDGGLRFRPRAVLAPEGGRAAHERSRCSAIGYLMDYVVPGGVARDLGRRRHRAARATNATRSSARSRVLRDIYDEHAGLQDRFIALRARRRPSSPASSGLTGLAGARERAGAGTCACDFPCAPYDALDVRMATHRNGDVAARVAVRFEEIARVAAPGARDRRAPAAGGRSHAPLPTSPALRTGPRLGRRLARRGAGRARERRRRHDPPLPSARSVVARTGRCSSTR